jgi:lipopolysaccharide biosynthesis glycosyltransferase
MIRMFIGSSSNGEDAQIEAAYEYSLRKNTNKHIEINWMRQTADDDSFWYHENTERWSTPFSGYRWFIPEHCGFKGRAIYTDCDMINFRDINELWNVDLAGKPIGARRGTRFDGHEFCVMVIDNEKMREHLIPVERQADIQDYHHRMIAKFSGNADLVEDLDPRWNCLDGEELSVDKIWQLHYTNMATQPWQPEWYTGPKKDHPREDIVKVFYDTLAEAEQAGHPPKSFEHEIDDYLIIGQ